MTHKEATERRKMMARAWAMKNPDGTPKYTTAQIGRMFSASDRAVQQLAVDHRKLFPYRLRGHDAVAYRVVSRA